MSPGESGALLALLQNSEGDTLSGPKLRGTQIEGSKTPRGKDWRQICRAKFWTPQSAPCKVLDPSNFLEQCNMCPAFSWKYSYGGLNIQKNLLQIKFSLVFLRLYLYTQEKMFHVTVPLRRRKRQTELTFVYVIKLRYRCKSYPKFNCLFSSACSISVIWNMPSGVPQIPLCV